MSALKWGNALLLGLFYLLELLLMYMSLRVISQMLSKEPLKRAIVVYMFLLIPALAGWCVGMILQLLTVRLLSASRQTLYDISPELYGLLPITVLLLLTGIILSVWAYCRMAGQERSDRERMLLAQQIDAVRAQVEEYERVNNSIRGMKHDMKNHLAVIRELSGHGDREGLTAYLDSIDRDAAHMDRAYQTGDVAVDALLAIKEQELRELGGVTFDADEFILPPTAAAMSYDLCVILGNALDNAIRACKEMKEHKEDSQITLTASVTGSSLLITLPSS